MTDATSSAKALLFCDLERELAVTRKVLARIPTEHFTWKPHAKSMAFGQLAQHVAELPNWLILTLDDDQLDFANPPPRHEPCKTSAELLALFDDNAARTLESLSRLSDADLNKTWTLRNGEAILHQAPKSRIARIWCLNHMISHRAQLCVYLRLLDLPVPAIYFNSADEPDWNFE